MIRARGEHSHVTPHSLESPLSLTENNTNNIDNPNSRRSKQHRRHLLCLVLVFMGTSLLFGVSCTLLESAPGFQELSPKQNDVTKTPRLSARVWDPRNETEKEPDLATWWESILHTPSPRSEREKMECEWFLAPKGMSVSLLPACEVRQAVGASPKPRCTTAQLNNFTKRTNGTTRAHCVKKGFQSKCYTRNIILQQGQIFTYGAEASGLPSRLYLADGQRAPLVRYHNYRGTSIKKISTPRKEEDASIFDHCKYVVHQPAILLFRMSGHSTYHMWENNLGPFFSTLFNDFPTQLHHNEGGSRHSTGTTTKERDDVSKDNFRDPLMRESVFGTDIPLIIIVDHKPRKGPKAPLLLDELLHYFTDTPILDASEFTDPICLSTAVLGISSESFKQSDLRQWLLPRIALRHRLLQLHRMKNKMERQNKTTSPISTAVASDAVGSGAHQTMLRCLLPNQSRRHHFIPPVIDHWLYWRFNQWRHLPTQPHVLYLSRNHPNISRGRKVVNEADVLRFLEATVHRLTDKPLRRLFLEEMAPVDQIMTMAGVNILIAPHGGGVANCVWMPPGSVVVEFVAPAGATLPKMYHKMCRRTDTFGVVTEHIPFVAKQDPAELDAHFAETNKQWKSNRRLFSNIWMPPEQLAGQLVKAVELYRKALERTQEK